MPRQMTMVLVDTFQALDEHELKTESYRDSVMDLISRFDDDFCETVSSHTHDHYAESELQEAVIGFLEPERLVSKVQKYADMNLKEATAKLKIAESLLKKHNTTISELLTSENIDRAIKDEYAEALWKVAECLNILCGREGIELFFYDLTDSSSRVSEAQMKSIRENPEAYSLVPIAFKY